MAKTNRLKKFVVRYAWAGPIIGFAAGFLFGPGVVGQIIDFRLKSHSVSIEQIKLQKDFFEKLQGVQDEIKSELEKYFSIRDELYRLQAEQSVSPDLQRDFWSSHKKTQDLVTKYNQLEDLYSSIDGKPPQYFNFQNFYKSLPLLPPKIGGFHFLSHNSEMPTGQNTNPPESLFFLMRSDPILSDLTNLYKANGWQDRR